MGQNHIFFKMTYRQMVKNKVRTLVTIIGIMLSAALITAITVFIASLHKSMLDYKIKESGNWYGVIEQVDLKEGLEKIRQDSDILSERLMYNIGSTIEEQDGHQISVKAFSDENEISRRNCRRCRIQFHFTEGYHACRNAFHTGTHTEKGNADSRNTH
jgi:hypothetical protein